MSASIPAPVSDEIIRSKTAESSLPFHCRINAIDLRSDPNDVRPIHANRHPRGGESAVTSASDSTRSAASARARARRMPSRSTAPAASRRPAVSTTVSGYPATSRWTSMRSRVVPGSLDTMATSRRAKALMRLDFPELTGPTTTTSAPCRRRSARWSDSSPDDLGHHLGHDRPGPGRRRYRPRPPRRRSRARPRPGPAPGSAAPASPPGPPGIARRTGEPPAAAAPPFRR